MVLLEKNNTFKLVKFPEALVKNTDQELASVSVQCHPGTSCEQMSFWGDAGAPDSAPP